MRVPCAVATLLVLTSPLSAQAPADSARFTPLGGGRTLGGHTYVLLATVPQPFTGTFFVMSVGGSAALSVTDPVVVDVGGQVDTVVSEGDLVFGSVDVAFQQRVNPRLAVRASASLTARGGTNARLIFSEGLSGLSTYAIGGLLNLHRARDRMLTATLDYRRGNLTELTLDEFADYVAEWGIDSVEHWGDHLVADRKNSRLVAGVRGAWAWKPWLGFSGVFETGPTNLYESGSKLSTTLGVGASLDVHELRPGIPVGVGLGFGRLRPPSRADDIFGLSNTLNWSLYYTGRPDLTLGIDGQHSQSKMVNTNETLATTSFRLVLRYDF